MNKEITVDKTKFDALLRRLIASPPTSMETAKAVPKVRKDGQLKMKRNQTPSKN
jgi:hypothetical protein